MGAGHVMRCLALAQAWQQAGGEVHLVSLDLAPWLADRCRQEGIAVKILDGKPGGRDDALQTAATAEAAGADWAVVDGYHLDPAFHRIIRDRGIKLLIIDDTAHLEHYGADLVLNQNLHAGESMYSGRVADARLLLGPHYVLLRMEFARWTDWKREFPDRASRLLLSLGGGVWNELASRVLVGLEPLMRDGLEVVVSGGSASSASTLEAAVPNVASQLSFAVDVDDVPQMMAGVDLALSAAGTTCWELALLQVPGLVFALAENQRPVAAALASTGAAINLGWLAEVTSETITRQTGEVVRNVETRRGIAGRARTLVDGSGAGRVVRRMLELHAEVPS